MKRELAERLAVTVLDDLTIDQVRKVIDEFLIRISTCPVCDGTGRFTFGANAVIEVADNFGNMTGRPIEPGTTIPCPLCGDGRGDPEFVAWHCYAGNTERKCRHEQESETEAEREPHSECGPRLVLPVPQAVNRDQ